MKHTSPIALRCVVELDDLLGLTFWEGAGILAWGGMGGDIPPRIALEDVREVVTDRRSSGIRALARVDAMLFVVL